MQEGEEKVLPTEVPHLMKMFQQLAAPNDASVAVTGTLGAACENDDEKTLSLVTVDSWVREPPPASPRSDSASH